MESITSRENRQVKEYCKLAASKKERDTTGKFVLESLKLVLEAFQNQVNIEKVFLTAQAMEKYREKLFELLNSNAEIYCIAPEVSRKMAETDTPQGVFAVCRKLDKSISLDTIKRNGVYAALSELQDPGNMGTLFRTAEALGICGILLSRGCCDVYSPKVLRAAMGSVFRLPFWISENFCEELKNMSKSGITTYAAVVDEAAEPVTGIPFHGGVAVIGNEGNGLSEDVIRCCDRKITVPMKGNAESLNAAMAAGIILWQMTLD